jgi:branched-chain amino acid transport system ATP-binding protein
VTDARLVAEGVGIEFGGLKALADFQLRVCQGDLLGLIGPNGAGKTTAFNVLTGVYAPTRGHIAVNGQSIVHHKPHQITRLGLARTFQNIRLFKDLSVLDNVKVACAVSLARGQTRSGVGWQRALQNSYDWWRACWLTPRQQQEEQEITRRAQTLLDVMGLRARERERAKDLPYGAQRRLEIARALATEPKVLLLDEPAAGMNTREKVDLMDLIREIRDRFELGILLIEHDMKLVMGICERITVLDHGQIIAVGSPQDVRADRRVIEAYLGEAAPAP